MVPSANLTVGLGICRALQPAARHALLAVVDIFGAKYSDPAEVFSSAPTTDAFLNSLAADKPLGRLVTRLTFGFYPWGDVDCLYRLLSACPSISRLRLLHESALAFTTMVDTSGLRLPSLRTLERMCYTGLGVGEVDSMLIIAPGLTALHVHRLNEGTSPRTSWSASSDRRATLPTALRHFSVAISDWTVDQWIALAADVLVGPLESLSLGIRVQHVDLAAVELARRRGVVGLSLHGDWTTGERALAGASEWTVPLQHLRVGDSSAWFAYDFFTSLPPSLCTLVLVTLKHIDGQALLDFVQNDARSPSLRRLNVAIPSQTEWSQLTRRRIVQHCRRRDIELVGDLSLYEFSW